VSKHLRVLKDAGLVERRLPDPPAVVWRALTEREELQSWFPCGVIVAGGRWEVGAAITFPFPPEVIDLTLTGEVLEVGEANVLAFTWGDETLRFELSLEGDRTLLVLIDEIARRPCRSQRRLLGHVSRPPGRRPGGAGRPADTA
jgi:uncharacterized protein YndB with AHSA1/START domain